MSHHWGPAILACWRPQTFDIVVVQDMAKEACPNFPLIADLERIADALNEAAHDLLLSLMADAKPAAAKDWAGRIDAACSALIEAIGAPSINAAMRLGFHAVDDLSRLSGMLETAKLVRSAARRHSATAYSTNTTTTVARPVAENAWIECMATIFWEAFVRKPGITKTKNQRGGPCPRFIAAAARRLLKDERITNPPTAWTSCLQRFVAEKSVAGRLEQAMAKRAALT